MGLTRILLSQTLLLQNNDQLMILLANRLHVPVKKGKARP